MKTILEKLEINAKKLENKAIFGEEISGEHKSISYGDFVRESKAVASGIFETIGAEKNNKPIVVFDNRNINTLVGLFGVMYSRNFYVVLDSNSPMERLQKIVDVLNPVLAIYSDENNEKLQSIHLSEDTKLANINELLKAKINEKVLSEKQEKRTSNDPIYSLFTSGSTGVPKGTMLTHKNVLSYIEWFTKEFKIDESVIFGNQTPFYFSMSVSDIFGCVYGGSTFNIVPKSYFSFPIQLVRLLNEQKINTIYWVPSVFGIVANINLFKFEKPKYLKTVLFAGEVMPNKWLNYWRDNLDKEIIYANLFGPTETTDICTFYVCKNRFEDDESLPIGVHCDNCDTFLIDENGKEVTSENVIGELYVKSPFVASGYYDNMDKTKEAFVQNPLHNHYPDIVYKTGDLVKLATIDGEQVYIYAGRKDFQIKHAGYRIELGEIETNIRAVEGVNTAVCLYDSEIDNIILVYEGKVKENQIIEEVKTKVPYYMVPNVVIKISQMPYNANGKIDRNYLKNNYKTLKK